MHTRSSGIILGGIATTALVSGLLTGPADASPPVGDPGSASKQGRTMIDNRVTPLQRRQTALAKKAAELVVNGEAKVQSRGGSKAVKVSKGQWVEYGTQQTTKVLSFLVQFGDKVDPDYPNAPTGPLHNQIKKPPASDNSTYWKKNFNPKHYKRMFFTGLPDQNGESFRDYWSKMSSGRFDVTGDVSPWVTVPKSQASYGRKETNKDMTRFIADSAKAWVEKMKSQGMSKKQIQKYVASFDVWDRYDFDSDGDFNEPDGYIDRFQAIHAGEGEEAGAPKTAIWSHSWMAGYAGVGVEGPDGALFGGVRIPGTKLWISNYTTEPENGGIGVFAHEFSHDLGVPDLYDTNAGENGTGFWTLMSQGSWMSHRNAALGTSPNALGPVEKLQLGWLDYDVADSDRTSRHLLGPASQANTKGAQALITRLPDGEKQIDVGPAAEGSKYLYSGRGDDRTATTTSPSFTVPAGGQLAAKVNYQIETDWDYAYAEISTDGGETFTPLETNLSTNTNPNGQNDGNGITGSTNDTWVDLTADLSQYAGDEAMVRFRMFNDAVYNELGFKVDAITVGTALEEDVEDGADDWTNDGFVVVTDGSYSQPFTHYYVAENRTYTGYDQTLAEGPYNFGWAATPNKVERFPMQNGLLVWYWNSLYPDNNTSQHPGGGEALPVDARASALKWSDGTVVRNRIQSFDSTFGLEKTDRILLHKVTSTEWGSQSSTLRVPPRKPVATFDDSDPNAYWDPANPTGSVKVAGLGVTITVLRQGQDGKMTVQVN